MHPPSEIDWAWAAGLFEGEGCIGLWKQKSGRIMIHLQLTTTDLDVLEKFTQVVGGGIMCLSRSEANRGCKQAYRWNMAKRREALATMERFLPYLGERRRNRYFEVKGYVESGVWSKKEVVLCED